MNKHIEKMVEEFYEYNGDITSDWLRAALTSAYNAGLERAKEVCPPLEDPVPDSTYGDSGYDSEAVMFGMGELMFDWKHAIEKEKLSEKA